MKGFDNRSSGFTLAELMIIIVILALLFLAAITVYEKKKNDSQPMASVGKSKHATVSVYFATDRSKTRSVEPGRIFGSERGSISYGKCDVSIPHDHRMGELESPSFLRLEFSENPDRHVVLLRTSVFSQELFYSEMAARIKGASAQKALMFVHGYNVSFEDAARRTAQIAYDLAFDGIPVFYSWPSKAKASAYVVDEQNIEWSQSNFKTFLVDFLENTKTDDVYLIAHSMGSRAVARVMSELMLEKPNLASKIREIVLAAPDIDADVFRRDIAPSFAEAAKPLTLYASSKDLALIASKQIHGYPRAGDSGRGLLIVKGVETIDASNVDTSLVGHSFYGDSTSVMSDIFYLIRNGARANQRFGLQAMPSPEGEYWMFKK